MESSSGRPGCDCAALFSMTLGAEPGVLLAYSSNMYCKIISTGMLIIMVSRATRMVNTGSDGGLVRLHDKSSLLQVH